ncbi:MAG: penicillin-binding protein 1C [Bacteroidetes bacterium]|nr:penicillin-binding protein 1C [Bacteroidota bacterium]
MKLKKVSILITSIIIAVLFFLVLSVSFLPRTLFKEDYSTVVLDRNGRLLGAKLSTDEQWRFHPMDVVPPKFKAAILAYEDQYFYKHPGINPISIFSSLSDNIAAGRVVRGGSTISMQVIRMSRNGKERTIGQKLIESFLTIGMEALFTKDSILSLYCSNAPMGGNIVGLNAASWRYFGHAQHELSWAEAATLAVLPNSPSLIHPGKNRNLLFEKRNGLLAKLLVLNQLDSVQYQLALLEEIPKRPKPLPSVSPHLIEYLAKTNRGKIIQTTIDYDLQIIASQIANKHAANLLQNGINNVGLLIVSPVEKEILAYVGNLTSTSRNNIRDQYNDMVRANRSTGSILKPFLFASMIGEGLLLPNSLVRDIPSYFNDYHPENYNNEFVGAVPASQALSQSLNVPAVYMLQKFGTARFLNQLHKLGFTSFKRSSTNYGLTLILGGGEASLMELVNAYAGMASTLLSYDENYGEYPADAYGMLKLVLNEKNDNTDKSISTPPLTASSIWLTYDALKKVSRPESEEGWEYFSSSSNIAWKTGTSHGFKDAWAIGTTADYIVGVWAGNADGEGRTGLTGTKIAAPMMFDVFSILDCSNKFYPAYDEMVEIVVCKQSGNLASQNCNDVDTIMVALKGAESKACTYHRLIFTDTNNEYRLSQRCSPVSDMIPVSWFVLPPVQELYYQSKHPGYNTLPPYADGCEPETGSNEIEFIYPNYNSSIYVATDEKQEQCEIVFEISHHYPESTVYWHLDNKLIGITNNTHQLSHIPEKGSHVLTVVDENGNSNSVSFEVVN